MYTTYFNFWNVEFIGNNVSTNPEHFSRNLTEWLILLFLDVDNTPKKHLAKIKYK